MIKKFAIQVAILLVVMFGALYFSFNSEPIKKVLPVDNRSHERQIKISDVLINAEVADTAESRGRGLGGRDSLAAGSGMLFVFPDVSKHQFWMKGMKFPLDMIFIEGSKVVDMIKNISPPSEGQKDEDLKIYEPTVPIDMMLEVNARFSEKNNIKVGDQVFLVK